MPKRRTAEEAEQPDEVTEVLFDLAVKHVRAASVGSASLLQKKMKLGFVRASRLFDLLVERGVLAQDVTLCDHKGRRFLVASGERDDAPVERPIRPILPAVEIAKDSHTKRILGIPDLHSPYVDPQGIAIILALLKHPPHDKPWDLIFLFGDIHDFYQVSHFDQNPERLNDLQQELDQTWGLLLSIREAAPRVKIEAVVGNHEGRLDRCITRNAPALKSLRTNSLKTQLHLDELGIHMSPPKKPFMLTPNFRMTHGAGPNDDGCKYSQFSAYSARYNLEKFWARGCSAHTHRAGAYFRTHSGQTDYWLECGCLCDRAKVSDDYATEANWQSAFAIFYQIEDRVHGSLIPIEQGECVVEGKTYHAKG